MGKYIYKVNKIWYDEEEVIESDVHLTTREIRNKIDERRIFCDELDVEEEYEEEEDL